MIYAVYRCLYGEDFIQESINSITDYVDKIFIFWDDRPWGDVNSCIYKGETVKFPEKFDNIIDKIKELNNPKIELIYDHMYNNDGQFSHFVNDIILPNYPKPDYLIFMEPDYVYRKDQIKLAINSFKEMNTLCAKTKQIEIWKGFNYVVPERNYRLASMFWNIKGVNNIPETGKHSNLQITDLPVIDAYVHNFGFAVSPKAMYWKHMTAIGFSQKIKDSKPAEDWYEEKWLKWDYETNNKDLEISENYRHLIAKVEPYDVNELPESIKTRL